VSKSTAPPIEGGSQFDAAWVFVTCIKKEGDLVRNYVRREGHVAHSPQSEGGRCSTRLRRENIRLEDYTL